LPTFVAVADGEEVNVVALRVEKQKADPGIRGVDWYYEQYSDYPSLFRRVGVPSQVVVDLKCYERFEMRVKENNEAEKKMKIRSDNHVARFYLKTSQVRTVITYKVARDVPCELKINNECSTICENM
jgi:hypothetical protein